VQRGKKSQCSLLRMSFEGRPAAWELHKRSVTRWVHHHITWRGTSERNFSFPPRSHPIHTPFLIAAHTQQAPRGLNIIAHTAQHISARMDRNRCVSVCLAWTRPIFRPHALPTNIGAQKQFSTPLLASRTHTPIHCSLLVHIEWVRGVLSFGRV
jgi:hypothetical protein